MGCTDDNAFVEGREIRAGRSTTCVNDAAELSGNHVFPLIYEARDLGIDFEYSTAVAVCVMCPHQHISR